MFFYFGNFIKTFFLFSKIITRNIFPGAVYSSYSEILISQKLIFINNAGSSKSLVFQFFSRF